MSFSWEMYISEEWGKKNSLPFLTDIFSFLDVVGRSRFLRFAAAELSLLFQRQTTEWSRDQVNNPINKYEPARYDDEYEDTLTQEWKTINPAIVAQNQRAHNNLQESEECPAVVIIQHWEPTE